MKQIASNYTYSPTTNVVTLTGVNIDQDQLLLVVAPQVGRTMYNFASGVTGAVSAGADTRVTLNASTAGLTTTSPLVIFYDDQASTQTIAGTVAANAFGFDLPNGAVAQIPVHEYTEGFQAGIRAVPALIGNELGGFNNSNPLPISGTVTVGNSVTIGSIPAAVLPRWEDDNQGGNQRTAKQSTPFPVRIYGDASSTSVTFGATITNSVTIGSLPAISGTVTAAAPNGSLTTRFGTPTTANVSFATSAVTNASRKYLLIQNVTTGSNVITVGIGFTPTTTQGIQLTAGAGITFESSYIPTGAVYVLSSVTASNFTILEG